MAATRADISEWFDKAKKNGCCHLMVVCDQFDYEDFPVYVDKPEDVAVKMREYHKERGVYNVMEVYDLTLNKEEQMNEFRAWHTPKEA